MTKDPKVPNHIDKALKLDGKADSIKDYYAVWSRTYDIDLAGDHVAPSHLAKLLQEWLEQNRPDSTNATAKVMDVGCGTGLVGRELHQLGFRSIDGVDLSPDMVEQASKLNMYRTLSADLDINRVPPSHWHGQYDIVTCCGVFTLGHVEPQSLLNMCLFAKPKGLLLATTRTAYYDQTEFQAVHDQAIKSGVVSLLQLVRDAPYTNDSKAHYWLYQVN